MGHHLDSHDHQHNRERHLQIPELVDHARQSEVEAAQPENCEDIARKDQERVTRDGENGRDRVHREDEVCELDHDEGQEQRGGEQGARRRRVHDPVHLHGCARRGRLARRGRTRADEEVLPVEALGHREEAARQPDHQVATRVHLVGLEQQHLDPGDDQEGPEYVDDPTEALDELGTHGDHGATHHEGAHDPPEQHAVLVHRGDGEEAEEHRDDEDVIHGERLLDQIPGHVLHRRAGAIVVHETDAFHRRRGQRHEVGGQPQAKPVALVADINEECEGETEANPERGPPQGLPDGHDVGGPVKDPKVEGQQEQHEGEETEIHPEHQTTPELARNASSSRRSARTSSRINRVWASPSPLRSSDTCDCIALTTTAMNRFKTMNVAISR